MPLTWPSTSAARLFSLMQPALDTLPATLVWSLGGGTALAMWLDHRVSHDIDLFFESSQALRLLSPQRNPLTKAVTPQWREPGHYLKFEVIGVGEIDILVTRDWTDPAIRTMQVSSTTMSVQTPAEILARKIAYRASSFKVRDFFDLAAMVLLAPDELRRLRPILSRHRAVLRQRWKVLEPNIAQFLAADIHPTATGTDVISRLPSVINRLLGQPKIRSSP